MNTICPNHETCSQDNKCFHSKKHAWSSTCLERCCTNGFRVIGGNNCCCIIADIIVVDNEVLA